VLYDLLEKWAVKANLVIAVYRPLVFVPTGMPTFDLDSVIGFKTMDADCLIGMRWWRPTGWCFCNKKGCMWHDVKPKDDG